MNANIMTNDNNEIIFSFAFKSIHHKIALRSITYFESSGRKCYIHTSADFQNSSKNDEIAFYGKLDELSELLSEYGFIRCHQSYLVSLQQADKYHNKLLYFHEKSIPVSDRYRSNIIKIFNSQINTHNLIIDTKRKDSQQLNTQTITSIGVLICISGEYKGTIIRIYPDIAYELGRDGNTCDIVVNQPFISRNHCTLTYHDNGSYSITDHSKNGTYEIENSGFARKLTTDKNETLYSGAVICFGDRSLQYRLI